MPAKQTVHHSATRAFRRAASEGAVDDISTHPEDGHEIDQHYKADQADGNRDVPAPAGSGRGVRRSGPQGIGVGFRIGVRKYGGG